LLIPLEEKIRVQAARLVKQDLFAKGLEHRWLIAKRFHLAHLLDSLSHTNRHKIRADLRLVI
jgi:hypothetical protein